MLSHSYSTYQSGPKSYKAKNLNYNPHGHRELHYQNILYLKSTSAYVKAINIKKSPVTTRHCKFNKDTVLVLHAYVNNQSVSLIRYLVCQKSSVCMLVMNHFQSLFP